ncbi:MAG: DsbA family protein [Deltaproteobacteria bacterium]|nr:DsbA family protein [Deltaproteobacteria bacterium]
MRKAISVVVGVLFLVFSTGVYAADNAADKKSQKKSELAEVKTSIQELKNDIKDLKMLLGAFIAGVAAGGGTPGQVADIPQQLPPNYPYPQPQQPNQPQARPPIPTEATTTTGDGPILGNQSAKVTIVEFSDYECPFCARFHIDTMKQLKKDYIDTGKVRFSYRDFPLPFHQSAMKAATAANCAQEQGKYWEMNFAIFENQKDIADIDGIGKKAGLDVAKLNTCISSNKYADKIANDTNDGRQIGVGGTPSFIIAKTSPDGTVKGKLIAGAVPYSVFKTEIDSISGGK